MKKLVVANWKMHPVRLKEAEKLFDEVVKIWKKTRKVEVVVCPPFVYLYPFRNKLGISRGFGGLVLGSQNAFWAERGAYTGEIPPKMLKDFGAKYVIVGHSERRRWAKETDAVINKKLLLVVKAGLKPIFCVGEKEGENINAVLRKQLQRGLKGFPLEKLKFLTIAYEPVWAVGTGRPLRPDTALVAKMLIRRILLGMWRKRAFAHRPRILYGGSITSKISQSYITEGQMDGILVGGASLKSIEFIKIVDSVSRRETH